MQGKLKQIQGIRALAILGIFITHTSVWLADDLGTFACISWRFGGAGVATFFIISGFLLAYMNRIVPEIEKKGIIKAAWGKASKLYVLYLITFFIAFAARTKWPLSARDGLMTSISAMFNLTMTQSFVPFDGIINGFNGPAWFLSALFGIWIIIYLFPHGVNKLMTLPFYECIISLGILLIGQELWGLFSKYCISPLFAPKYVAWFYNWLVYHNPLMCFSEFCVGIILGRICAQKQLPVVTQNVVACITLLIVVLYAMMLMTARVQVSVSMIPIAECFACMGIISVMSPKAIGHRILANPILVWLGNISGYFFLIHGATNFAMHATIERYIPKPWLFFVSLIISIFLSVVADYCYNSKNRIKS